MHKSSRETLLKGNRSYFLKIIENSPELLVGFPDRAKSMIPYAHEGFALLSQLGCLRVTEDGGVTIKEKTIKKSIQGTDDNRECQKVARYLGRQFARISDRATIYASLGVRP